MRVDWAIACRYAEVHDNLGTIIGAGIDHTFVPGLPHPVVVSLAIRLVFLPQDDVDAPHSLRVVALAPGGATLAEVPGDVNLTGPVVATDWLQGLIIPMAIQFMAESEGRHNLEVTIDGHTIAVPMTVALGPGAPSPPDPAE